MNSSENPSNCQLGLIAVLTSLLLMCGGVGLFFFHQASLLKGQVNQCEKIIAEYNNASVAKVNAFVAGMQNVSRSNPELLAILSKYGLQPGAPQSLIAPPSNKK